MGVWLGPMGIMANFIEQNDINYSTSDFMYTSSGKNWEIALTSSGTLSFAKNPGKVDIFIVAGGQTAPRYDGERNAYSGPAIGDPGGAGGECITIEGLRFSKEQDYSVTVGGSDENSTITIGGTTYIARSGFGSRGGSGANYTSSKQEAPENGDDGVFAYGKSQDTVMVESFIGHKFGPGGGGGGAHLKTGAYSGAGLGGESNGAEHQYGKGGRYMVGYLAGANGSDGYDNHGQGGGGAAYYWLSHGGGASRLGDPGAGGSGVIFIRNHRS